MKEPDIKFIKNKLGISDESKFIGYVILDSRKGDFLYSRTGDVCAFSFMEWISSPNRALKFRTYCDAMKVINDLEINYRSIVMIAFDLGMHIGVIDMPSFSEMVN